MLTFIYHLCVLAAFAVSLGGVAYYVMAIAAARRLRRTEKSIPSEHPFLSSMSLLKPLGGADRDLERHIESFFVQDYPVFEILFAVRQKEDPAVPIVQSVMARHPDIPAKLTVTGDPPCENAKAFSMEKMAEVAQHEILVVTDSDTSVTSGYLRALAQSFESREVGAVTNLYRGVAGSDLWSKLEALGMSTEFMAGVIVAERLEGMKFMLGPSMAVRSETLRAIGGFAALAEYLADDFVLGERVARSGSRVILSRHVIDHHVTAGGFVNSFCHRLRWNRSSRFSRPLGYLGQGFTYGLAWALALCLLAPSRWSAAALVCSLAARAYLAIEIGTRLLEDPWVLRRLWLVPLQDLLSFVSWLAGFLGREIVWRKIRYRLAEGGRFVPVDSQWNQP
jgi:ceramide glucosyltransferase